MSDLKSNCVQNGGAQFRIANYPSLPNCGKIPRFYAAANPTEDNALRHEL
jgi:hypothetical protein